MLKCYLLLLIVGLAYALPAENPAKKKEPEAPAPIAPQSLEQENRNEAAAAQNPAAVAGDLVASAEKPKEGAATDEKKESLDSAETLWGWGGYGRGWGGGWGGGWGYGGGWGGPRWGYGGGWGGRWIAGPSWGGWW